MFFNQTQQLNKLIIHYNKKLYMTQSTIEIWVKVTKHFTAVIYECLQ
jgi:hypothetical protein